MAEYAIICCHHTFVEKIEEAVKRDMPEKQYSTHFLFRTLFYSYMSDNVLQLSVDKFYTGIAMHSARYKSRKSADT